MCYGKYEILKPYVILFIAVKKQILSEGYNCGT